MPIRRTRATTASAASLTSKSPAEHEPVLSSIVVSPSPREVSHNDQTTQEGTTENRDAEEDLARQLPAEVAPTDPPAMESSFADHSIKEHPSAEVIPPAEESPSNTLPAIEPPTTLPQLNGPSGDPQHAKNLAVESELPSDAPLAKEHLRDTASLCSPIIGQEITEIQAGYRQTADGLSTSLPEEKITKRMTGIFSQGQSATENQSQTHEVKCTPTVEALRTSGELSEHKAYLDHELHKDLPSNPPSCDTLKNASQLANRGADGRSRNTESSRKRARPVVLIDLTSDLDDESGEPIRKRVKHERSQSGMRQAPGSRLPDSPESSIKTSEDESRRRKGYSHHRFTDDDLSKHMDNEKRWSDDISKKCDSLAKHLKQQTECIKSLYNLNDDCGLLIAQLSVSGTRRQQIHDQLVDLDEKMRAKNAELRRNVFSTIHEGNMIKESAASWYAREQKVTERIERSR